MSLSEAMLELPREEAVAPPPATARFGAREFFGAFFAELETRGIAYAILHGGDDLPERIDSDIDFAVHDADLAKLGPLITGLAREHGWVVAQRWQHEVFSTYAVVIDPNDPAQHLALDACSHFCRSGCFLVRDTVLLGRRARHANGFFVTSAASEFTYRLAKTLAGGRRLEAMVPRLRELWVLDSAGAQRAFDDLIAAGSVEKWLFGPKPDAAQLARLMRARTRYGLSLRVAELARRARRLFCPPGFHVALLGPDGAGKSTLIENVTRLLKPCFPAQRTYKFRPDVFGRIVPETQPTPHLREPRSTLVSYAKIAYYFADWWLGLFMRLWPARRRGTLVVFDRNFADLAVDQRRYLVQGVGVLAQILRRLVPQADATFILDADPARVHARKPELPVDVLARQRHA
jgi:thymidylate kinase